MSCTDRPAIPAGHLTALVADYAVGLIDRNDFVDEVALLPARSPAPPPDPNSNDPTLPPDNGVLDLDRAYFAGLVDDETYRDVYTVRRLYGPDPGIEAPQ